MPKLTKTYSANSLKLLDFDPQQYILKYKEGLFLNPAKESTKAGEKLHSFLCYYLKNFDMTKFEASLSNVDKTFLNNIKTFDAVEKLKSAKNKDIEQPFLIKCTPQNALTKGAADFADGAFYLTGRFDAILKDIDTTSDANTQIKIYDWKTQNLPKDPENDIQTIVYLYCASKLYKTQNVSITYISLTKNESVGIPYNKDFDYFKRIFDITRKAPI